jgi:hypothetical protein
MISIPKRHQRSISAWRRHQGHNTQMSEAWDWVMLTKWIPLGGRWFSALVLLTVIHFADIWLLAHSQVALLKHRNR